MADCSEKISREHVVTHGISKRINFDGNARYSGLPFQEPGEIANPGTEALAAKILCTRHNTALSPLDDVALRLQTAFQEVLRLPFRSSARGVEQLLFNGHSVERWMVKVLLGKVMSKSDREGGVRLTNPAQPPEELLAVLEGRTLLPQGQGLFVRANPNMHKGEVKTLEHMRLLDVGTRVLHAIVSGEVHIIGVEVRLSSFDLILWATDWPISNRPDLGSLNYRPPAIYSETESAAVIVSFSWEEGTHDAPVEFRVMHDFEQNENQVVRERWGHRQADPPS